MLLPVRNAVLSALSLQSNPSTHAPSFSDGVCNDPDISDLPFCDSSQSMDVRVSDLVSRIPLQEAVGMLIDRASEAKSVKLPPYMWWGEALHGVAHSPAVTFEEDVTPFATSFPQIIGLSSSFNRTLFQEIGIAVSTEGRAFYNSKTSGLTFWTPNINIFRDPRWGRGQETPGEDPLLTSEYGSIYVRALQGEAPKVEGSDSGFLKVSACCKHFSAYSQESQRHEFDAIVSKRDTADTYMPAFEKCVTEGHVSSVMCSYNAVNGIPACADKHLLTDIVRDTWGLDGYITSDCEAVADIIYNHHYTQSPAHTCAAALNAGMDLNCGSFLSKHLPKAVADGIVTRDMIDTALKRLVKVQMRLGMFEKGKQPFGDISTKDIDTPEHRALALQAARQSMVLLKNEDNTLPLEVDAFTSDAPLALIGPHLNASQEMLANYFGIPAFIKTPLDGISDYVKHVEHSEACGIGYESIPNFNKAVEISRQAERVVVFVGLNQAQEREEHDRTHIRLPGYQTQLIEHAIAASKLPIILVVLSGGSVDLSAYKNHEKVGAILYAGYPGQSGGQAIAETLFGASNPSGRLTQTFYDQHFADICSLYDYSMRPDPVTGNPGRTYRFYSGQPVYAFGHGLSYTSFDYKWKEMEGDCVASFAVKVQNTGEKEGEDVLLVYAEPPEAGKNGKPYKSLVAYERLAMMQPNESKEVSFCLDESAFKLATEDGEFKMERGVWTIRVGDLAKEVNIDGSVVA